MASRSDFVAYVLDQLEGLGPATSRAMFGGHGIYVEGAITGLVVDDILYLKVDDENRARFEARGSAPFSYEHKDTGKSVSMSYWRVPGEVLDDADALVEWARTSLEASLRSKKPAKAGAAKPAKPSAAKAAKAPAAKNAKSSAAKAPASKAKR
ncbi:TfoX/Sxy family protein [Vulgatibacter incomptus]|uniref:Regulator protein n=1 Tax=Vulgatibacter incomptus TaxID=1391653 RepID=A0A0K1PB99_9BACT|nr:TfoX/Sxy family protein [Vulgatibacter incomptus]AKU90808.1 Regulator protein [Vulgatibacter incomptus]